MSESTEVWPPAPAPPEKPANDSTVCPACSRKLLTQTSALCNWCGARIDDPEYQSRAAETRRERDEVERAQVEAIVKEESRYGVLGRLRRRAKENPGPRSDNELTP